MPANSEASPRLYAPHTKPCRPRRPSAAKPAKSAGSPGEHEVESMASRPVWKSNFHTPDAIDATCAPNSSTVDFRTARGPGWTTGNAPPKSDGPDEPEVERQVPDLDPRRAVEGQRGRAREQLALGEEELPAVDEGAG